MGMNPFHRISDFSSLSLKKMGVVEDPTETALGISTYVSPDVPGFSAVLKGRFSDFLVHEIGLDSKAAYLDSLEGTASNAINEVKETQEPPPKKLKVEAAVDINWEEIETELSAIVGSESAQDAVNLLKTKQPQSKFVEMPSLPDKEARRNLHHWIRSRLAPVARSDTDSGKIRVWHLHFEKEMPNFNKFKSTRPPKSKAPKNCKYLQFVLYKENMDTGFAMSQIQRQMGGWDRGGRGRGRGGRNRGRGSGSRLRMGYAGMKDKRGITSQFITVPSSTPIYQLVAINRAHGGHGGSTGGGGQGIIRIGNFQFVEDELRLGRLKGNRFKIALRNVQTEDTTDAEKSLQESVAALTESGFINYFGVQRFGKYHDTHLTGKSVLKGDFEAAIDSIMSPKSGERPNVEAARQAWQNRFEGVSDEKEKGEKEKECAKRVLRDFGRFMQSEVAILQSLSQHPLDYKRAFGCIGKTMRMMFVHAVQSFLWNHAVSNRIETIGRKLVEGDLVLVNDDGHQEGIPEVKAVTKDDIAANTYSLEHVVMPLVGSKTLYPSNDSALLFDSTLQEHGLTRDHLTKFSDREYNVPGDYRKILCRPSNIEFGVVKYVHPQQPLLQTDLMAVDGIAVETPTEDACLTGLTLSFDLPSSAYATICLRELMKRPTSSEYQTSLELGTSS